MALPAAFVLIELLSLSVRKDRLFANAASTLALAVETVAAIPTAVVGLSALLLVRIETPQGRATTAAAIAFGAVAWLIAATRSTDVARERLLVIGRIVLAAAAAIATLSLLTNSHVQLATITIVGAIGALIAAHKHLAITITSLSTLTWAVAATAGTRWGLVFAWIATAAAIAVAIIDNVPNLSWFTIPSFAYLALFGRHDAQIADRPLSHTIEIWALCTIGAIALAMAARVAQTWRSQIFTVAGIAATISLFDAVAHNRPQFGAALITISLGGLAHGLLTRNAAVAHAGGLGTVYGLWTITAMHKIGFIEVYMIPIAIQMLIGGYALRRSAARVERFANTSGTIETPQLEETVGYPTHSWAAYSPGLITLLVPSLWVGLQTGIQSHLLFSGIVAVLAVAVGGTRRLGAPLLLGTGALVVITGDIAMGPARTVPAWMWLALGGCTLIATAIGMERTATTPLAAGRRLVDVVHDQFA